MSLISTRLSLTHLATIERDANAGTSNQRGNPNPPNWQQHLSGVQCRLWTTTGRERTNDVQVVVYEDMRMICTLDTDVTEQDRIGAVTDRGQSLIERPVGIRAVMRHKDHIELVLVQLS